MDGPLVRDGGVVFDGRRIAGVGSGAALRAAHPDAIVQDAGAAIILPGLVNAHIHLELSNCVAGEAPASFTDWIASIPGRIGPERDFATAARAGAAQSVRFGVTTVGDISQQCHITRDALRDGPLRAVSYGEVLGIGGTSFKVEELLARAMEPLGSSQWARAGLSPHATYSLGWRDYVRVARTGISAGIPIATHLAELPYEREFLKNRTGPLREFLERMGIWREEIEAFDGGPIELAKAAGLLDSRAILAHVNYCDDEEMAILARGNASVVYCPRTHDYFGHQPHRWREMLGRGINVAIGTDSCASSPNLNVVDDLRRLRQMAPEVSAATIWEMGTLRGARALGMEKEVGSLSIGKLADAVIFPVGTNDPMGDLLQGAAEPSAVWIGGTLMANHPAWRG